MAYGPFDLGGRVGLITGGNSGIGLGMAKAVAEAGADVVIWGTNAAKNAAAREELARTGRRVLRVNLDGAFYTLRAAARHMVERGGGGALVGTASLAAIEGAARNEHYAATKGGLVSMIRALAVELARHGIRANAILPGWIETNMTAGAIGDDRFRANVLPRIPTRRWGTGADFGGIAVYLMSDASAYHTGDSLLIDGGYSLF